MKSGVYIGKQTYVNPPDYLGPVVYDGLDAYVNEAVPFNLLYIDEIIVSMICIDGTDGKGNAFQLHAVCSDGQNHNAQVTWGTSAPGVAAVSSSGIVSGVSAGTAVISCSHNGSTFYSNVTIFATLPDTAGLELLPGGKYAEAYFNNTAPAINGLGELVGARHIARYNMGSNGFRFALFNDSKSIYHDVSASAFYRYNRTNAAGVYTDQGWFRNVYGGQVLTEVAFQGPLSSTLTIDGTPYSGNNGGSYTGPTDPALILYSFAAGLGTKSMGLSFALASASLADLRDRTQCPLFYVPQNFVKYENDGVRNNYTKILNFGTAGDSFSLASDNTPAGWF